MMVGRTKDGRGVNLSVTLSQSERDGKFSSILILGTPDDTKQRPMQLNRTPEVVEPAPLTRLQPQEAQRNSQPGGSGPLPATQAASRAQEMLQEELAKARFECATLQAQQDKLEAELSAARNDNKLLRAQLENTEATIDTTVAKGKSHEQEVTEALSLIRAEIQATINEVRKEIAARANLQPEPVPQPPASIPSVVASVAPVAPATPLSRPEPAVTGPGPELAQLQKQLDRQRAENRNQALIQSLLCEQVRRLDADNVS